MLLLFAEVSDSYAAPPILRAGSPRVRRIYLGL